MRDLFFEVKWRDYPGDNTWEPESGVRHTDAYETWAQNKKQRKKPGAARIKAGKPRVVNFKLFNLQPIFWERHHIIFLFTNKLFSVLVECFLEYLIYLIGAPNMVGKINLPFSKLEIYFFVPFV